MKRQQEPLSPQLATETRKPTQVDMCCKLQIKSQHECLLRELQLSLTDGLIRVVHPFSESETDSFLGWRGFQVPTLNP
jgi:hypothetical protein